MNRASRAACAIAIWACLASAAAVAAERVHTVAAGESASAIAKRYYGDYDLADLLLRLNGRSGTVIRPGERLRVPFCDVHEVGPGDTWSSLVERYLGRSSAWPQVAELNGLERGDPLRVGQKLVMPVVLDHTLERGESLASLAERFYGDPLRARLLQSFNRIEDPRTLSVGRKVQVPLMTLRSRAGIPKRQNLEAAPRKGTVAEGKPAALRLPDEDPIAEKAISATPGRAESEENRAADATFGSAATERAAEEAIRDQAVGRFRAVVRAARRAFEAGEFDRTAELLSTQHAAVAELEDIPARTEYWKLLTFVEVAFDRRERACAAWRSLGETGSSVKLDDERISPKIRDVLEACGG